MESGWFGIDLHDGSDRLHHRGTLEGTPARCHLVKNRPERELIGARIDRGSRKLLRGHVCYCAENDTDLGDLFCRGLEAPSRHTRVDELCEAKVEDFDEPVLGKHDVLGLQVSVHDSCSVRLFKPVRQLRSDAEQFDGFDRTRTEQFPQRRPRNVLHDQVVNCVLASDLVDRHDVRMVQRGSGARLALEPLETGRVRERH